MEKRHEKVDEGGCQRHNCDGCRSVQVGGDCPLMGQTKGRCKMRTKEHLPGDHHGDEDVRGRTNPPKRENFSDILQDCKAKRK